MGTYSPDGKAETGHAVGFLTGKDMPGSDSLTREEQVSSMMAFDDCLLSMDLPPLNIPRWGPLSC